MKTLIVSLMISPQRVSLMKDKERLRQLLDLRHRGLQRWTKGKVPVHYKRISIDEKEASKLATLGQREVWNAFHDKLYYTQSIIAGGILSGKYRKFCFCTASQMGKSWTFARVAILLAYKGHSVFVAGARKDTSDIIMGHVYQALQKANADIKHSLLGESKNQIDRLNKSLSKTRISFANGGVIQPITFGDTYGGLQMNSAIGRGGDYIIDEAAMVSDNALAEAGRADFSGGITAMISNPHKPGTFYSMLAEDECPQNRLVIWADALTAVEEERFTEEQVMTSTFADNKSTMRRYLLCELDLAGDSLFETPKVVKSVKTDENDFNFLGVDAAYKGKDNVCVALISITHDGITHCKEIETLDKRNWVDGVTDVELIREIARVARAVNAPLVCVDQGWGVWLIQGLIHHGVNALGVAFGGRPTPARVRAKQYAATNAYNLRAEMHLDLQNLIEDKMFDISEEAYEKVKDIFPYVLATRRANNLIQIKEKEKIKKDIGRSPDELDALILAIHAAIVFFGESNTFIE